jgi:hypothetical protein
MFWLYLLALSKDAEIEGSYDEINGKQQQRPTRAEGIGRLARRSHWGDVSFSGHQKNSPLMNWRKM